ncbi:APC family permease [Paenibacillus kobensis]|uniref:APC family permease n=1 Tax=Paenibacillus kobensis TaxID=59841 RepID=UPI000FDB36C3|nr:APC family permease [Paenibacillus kobensis]
MNKLSLFQLIFLGLAWTMPLVVFANYGIASEAARGYLPAAYAIALLAMSLTAYSYGQMAKALPEAGSAYGYASQAFHPRAGFIIGWTLLLDYLINPIVCCLLFSLYLQSVLPGVPFIVWVAAFIVLVSCINYFGIRLSAAVSQYSVLIQLAVIVLFCVLSVSQVIHSSSGGGVSGFTAEPLFGSDMMASAVLSGAALLCFSFLGFDTVSIMSEDVEQPKRNIPRAMLIIILICGVVDITVAYLGQSVFPGYGYKEADTASLELAFLVGGALMKGLLVGSMIGAMFTGAVSSVASVSRLLYVMGRDGVLPRRIFGYMHPKRRTPTYNVLIVGAVCLLAAFIPLDTAVQFVNFGALTAFGCVNLCVIKYYLFGSRGIENRRWRSIGLFGVLPLAGFGAIVWLFGNLSGRAIVFGLVWLALGLLLMLSRAVRAQSAASAGRPVHGVRAVEQ